MISRVSQKLSRKFLRLTSQNSWLPWEYGSLNKFLMPTASMNKFYFNTGILLGHNLFVIVRFPVTLREDHPLTFVRAIIHFIGVLCAVLLSIGCCAELIFSKNAIIEYYNAAFKYYQGFAGM